MERAKGVEPSTFSLATRRSTTELCPPNNFLLSKTLSLYTNHILTFRIDLIMERGTNQDSSVTTVTRLSPRAESDGLIFVHSLRSFTSQRGTNLACKFKVLPYPTTPFSNRDPNSLSFRV